MFKTKITYIGDNSSEKTYETDIREGKVKLSIPRRFKGEEKRISIHYAGNTNLPESSKFVNLKVDEPIVEALIEILQSFLKNDSTEPRREELTIKRSSNKTVVNIE